MKKILIGIIKIYQKVISPLTPPSCRFYPDLFPLWIEAIEKHGALKGFLACRSSNFKMPSVS